MVHPNACTVNISTQNHRLSAPELGVVFRMGEKEKLAAKEKMSGPAWFENCEFKLSLVKQPVRVFRPGPAPKLLTDQWITSFRDGLE